MRFASVILDIPTQALDAPYTYAVPEAPAEAGGYDVEVGCAVLVPFGHRQAVGFVVGLQELPDGEVPAGIDAAKVKPVVRAVSPAYFDEEGAACAQWLSERYLAPLSSCVRLFTPPGGVPRMVRAQAGYWRLEEPAVGEVDDRWVVPGEAFDGFEPRKNAVKQASIVEALRAGELRVAELAAEFGAVSSPVKALEKQGVVRRERRRRMRGMPLGSPDVPEGPGTSGTSGFTPSPKPPLTAGQASALAAIDAARERGAGEVVLVDGVTGSGKTEVYLQAIEAALAAGRTACVLVPEISLTPQTVGRFRGRFGDTVAVMHSRMGAGERYDQWDFIRSGAARVVVGARSALFTPLANVG
ncbi:DEAD/DEAH box helicase, partial [Gordonibacter urolithinfaciens]|uniref:primosomal protein N' family DNA-binding protein n=1 Tax=Gordonibacter urolithinfaciens TaxID=1335613 RepID=UPI003A8F24C9